jgi:hypothetical protein
VGSIRKASEQEYWTAIQRIWTFEEPSSRWARLCKSASKIAPSTYTFDTNGKWNQSQDEVFGEIYGPADDSACWLSAFFAACYALAEIERYDNGAFAYCAQNNVLDGKDTSVSIDGVGSEGDAGIGASKLVKTLVQHIIDKRNLSMQQASFLQHCVRSTPDWIRLLESGPWTGDSRVDFVRSILANPLALSELSPEGADGDVIGQFTKFEAVFHDFEASMRSQLPSGFLPKRSFRGVHSTGLEGTRCLDHSSRRSESSRETVSGNACAAQVAN